MQNTSQSSKRTLSRCLNPDTLSKCRGSRLTKCFQVVSPIAHLVVMGEVLEKGILIPFLTKVFFNAQVYDRIRKDIYSEGKIDMMLELELEELG